METRKMAFQPHGRSISLPSRLHPTSLRVEAELNTLRVLEESPPSSSSSIQSRLVGLASLYVSVNDLIRGPSTGRALSRYDQGRLVEDSLEDSVGFLSVLGTIRDLVSSLKDHVRDLQSALRRSNGGASSIASYIRARKHAKKEMAKCLRDLKEMETKACYFVPLLDVDLKLAGVVRVLREVVSITVSVFRSLLLFLSVPLTRSKTSSRWSLISKLVSRKAISATKGGSCSEVLNEVGSVDMAVRGKESLQVLQGRLRLLDSGIPGIESALEALFRCLVQKRVSLLNILSQ